MTALIFGGSAGLGRALARALAAERYNLILLARDSEDLRAEAAHLKSVYGVSVEWMSLDATMPRTIERLSTLDKLSSVRHLFFPLGMTNEFDDGLLQPEVAASLVDANLTSIIMTISLLLPQLMAADSGNIVGIGSIAAIRGRGRNIVYAAAKRGLESYFESLRHRTASSGVRVQFYRLGYMNTQMSFGKRLLFPRVSPEDVARTIVRNLGKDIGQATVPFYWNMIGFIIRMLPWRIYRQIHF